MDGGGSGVPGASDWIHRIRRKGAMYVEGIWWTLGSPPHPGQLNAVINAALDLLECNNTESARALLRAFSRELANNWPKDDQDMAEIGPDVGQNPSEVVE